MMWRKKTQFEFAGRRDLQFAEQNSLENLTNYLPILNIFNILNIEMLFETAGKFKVRAGPTIQ
jgi:hypothetical protein